MTVQFRIDSATLYTTEGQVPYQFSSDLTVLAGPTGVGKTTLLELIKYGLGGDGLLAPVVLESVNDVVLEVSIGAQRLRLARSVDQEKKKKVRVTDLIANERLHDHHVGAAQPSLNTLLLTSMGLPDDMRAAAQSGRSIKAGSRITFADIFSFLYIPQSEINRDIARSQDSYLEPKRKAVFELLFGLTDPDLLEKRSQASVLNGEIDTAEDHHKTVVQFLRDSNTQSREDAQAALDAARLAQEQAEAQRGLLRESISPVSDRETQTLRDLLNQAERSIADARATETSLTRQQEDYAGEIRRVQAELARLNRMRDAGERLAQIEFTSCPRCMQSLKNRTVPVGQCRVCLQPDESVSTGELDQYEASQLGDQIDEMRHQLDFLAQQIAHTRDAIRDREELLRHLALTIDARTADRVSPRLQAFSDATEKLAASRATQEHFENILMQWDRVADLADVEQDLRGRKARLQGDIARSEASLNVRRKYLIREISKEFNRVVSDLRIPGVQEASIHETNYLPLLNGKPFRQISRGGGIVTATQVAYWTALLAVALRERETSYPAFLLIDSPRLALNTEKDLSAALYRRLVTLAEANRGKLQLIIADNELPAAYRKDYAEIDFSYKKPTVATIRHPGKGAVKPLVTVGAAAS
ncbi:hypothetical protein GCM10009730_37880 [Streptomyces albidochromogenes]|uniref:AAA family ATPase n=1 Tax=Streptomyces albidochromogenes TaxID=329524 RepID=UPI00110F88E4|nr:AAA family ATPase [Streptomyces albidochromogenes]